MKFYYNESRILETRKIVLLNSEVKNEINKLILLIRFLDENFWKIKKIYSLYNETSHNSTKFLEENLVSQLPLRYLINKFLGKFAETLIL